MQSYTSSVQIVQWLPISLREKAEVLRVTWLPVTQPIFISSLSAHPALLLAHQSLNKIYSCLSVFAVVSPFLPSILCGSLSYFRSFGQMSSQWPPSIILFKNSNPFLIAHLKLYFLLYFSSQHLSTSDIFTCQALYLAPHSLLVP